MWTTRPFTTGSLQRAWPASLAALLVLGACGSSATVDTAARTQGSAMSSVAEPISTALDYRTPDIRIVMSGRVLLRLDRFEPTAKLVSQGGHGTIAQVSVAEVVASDVDYLKQIGWTEDPSFISEIAVFDSDAGEREIERLRSSAADGQLYVVANPAFPMEGDGFSARTVAYMYTGIVATEQGVTFIHPLGEQLNKQFQDFAAAAGRQPSIELAAAWVNELAATKREETGELGRTADSLLDPVVTPDKAQADWQTLDPAVRGFDDPIISPPQSIRDQLKPVYLQIVSDAGIKPEYAATSVVLRSKTGVVRSLAVTAGTTTSPVLTMPGEDIEVLVQDGARTDSNAKSIGVIRASDVERADRLLVEISPGDVFGVSVKAGVCGGDGGRSCPTDSSGLPARVPVTTAG